MVFLDFYISYSNIKIVFILIFTNINCITQIFIVIRIAINNIIKNIKRYKPIILYI